MIPGSIVRCRNREWVLVPSDQPEMRQESLSKSDAGWFNGRHVQWGALDEITQVLHTDDQRHEARPEGLVARRSLRAWVGSMPQGYQIHA